MIIHPTEADCAPVAQTFEAIDAAGNIYVSRTNPPDVALRRGGWHLIPLQMMYVAAEAGLDVWCRVGESHGPEGAFIRRPGWKVMLNGEFPPAMCFCIRFWPAQAEQGLRWASSSMIARLAASTAARDLGDAELAGLLQSEVPHVRLAAIRLVGARRCSAGGAIQ